MNDTETGRDLAQSVAVHTLSGDENDVAGYMLHLARTHIVRDLTRKSRMLQNTGCT